MNALQAGQSAVLGLPPLFDALAITVGALSGALYASRKNFDVMGVLAISVATGLGGGAVRDALLAQGTPAFLTNPAFLLYALLGALVALLFARWARHWGLAYTAVDVATLGVWVLLGTEKATQAGLAPLGVVFVGVVAAVGGGLIRDVLCGDVPRAFRPGHWEALSALAASVAFVALEALGSELIVAEMAALLVAAALTWASLHWDITTASVTDLKQMPVLRRRPSEPG